MVQYRGSTTPIAGETPTGSASNVTITDSGDYFDATTVEAALQELAVGEDKTVIPVYNGTGSTISAGAPVYLSSYDEPNERINIALADADDNAKMPCLGLVSANIPNGAAGYVVIQGLLHNVDTSSWSVSDSLYVSTTAGTLTSTRPTGASDNIQKIGFVVYSDAADGHIYIGGAGRSNDVPNLTTNKYWEGDGSNEAAEVTADDILANMTSANIGAAVVGAALTTDKVWAGVAGVAAEVDVHTLLKHVITIEVVPAGTATSVADGKAYFVVPSYLNGHIIEGVAACVGANTGANSSTDLTIYNVTQAADVLSTAVTIAFNEQSAEDGVIDTAEDDLTTGDVLSFNIDAITGGGAATGLFATLIIGE